MSSLSELLCWYRHQYLDFREDETKALLQGHNHGNDWLRPMLDDDPYSPLWRISDHSDIGQGLLNDQILRQVCDSSVLIKGFYEVLGGPAKDIEALLSDNETRTNFHSCYSSNRSFSISLTSVGRKLFTSKQQEREAVMERIQTYLNPTGKVNLSHPEQVYLVASYCGVQSLPYGKKKPLFLLLRQIAANRRLSSQLKALDVKNRRYRGPTTMDAELALIMCNLARVNRGSLVMDPFVGTGSLLLAAAKLGAFTMGSDVNGGVIGYFSSSKLARFTNSSFEGNFKELELSPPCGIVRSSIHAAPFVRRRHIFDAIITDPPYGIREGIRLVERVNGSDRKLPHHASFGEISEHLLDLARTTLIPNGRLVFWIPAPPNSELSDLKALLESYLEDSSFTVVSVSRQLMSSTWSRILIVLVLNKENSNQGSNEPAAGVRRMSHQSLSTHAQRNRTAENEIRGGDEQISAGNHIISTISNGVRSFVIGLSPGEKGTNSTASGTKLRNSTTYFQAKTTTNLSSSAAGCLHRFRSKRL